MPAVRYPVAVYNVGPVGKDGRGLDNLSPELHGLARTGAKVICLIETIGWGRLPGLPGYKQFRDRSTEGRANITAYVRSDLPCGDGVWLPCHQTWRQTRDGAQPDDRHPPREVLKLRIGDGSWLFSHDPPETKFRDTGPARTEHVNLIGRQMAPWLRDDWSDRTDEDRKQAKDRLRVNLGDPNGQGPVLAEMVGGWYKGSRVEGGTIVGGHWVDARVQSAVGGVRLCSDHGRAFLGTVVDDRP